MDLVNLSLGSAAGIGLLGYLVVFFGLVLLMIVVMIMGKIFIAKAQKAAAAAAAAAPAAPVPEKAVKADAPKAPGSAGNIALYDTDPKDAAMIMAIVADKMGKPVNELRFKSIKEVK